MVYCYGNYPERKEAVGAQSRKSETRTSARASRGPCCVESLRAAVGVTHYFILFLGDSNRSARVSWSVWCHVETFIPALKLQLNIIISPRCTIWSYCKQTWDGQLNHCHLRPSTSGIHDRLLWLAAAVPGGGHCGVSISLQPMSSISCPPVF